MQPRASAGGVPTSALSRPGSLRSQARSDGFSPRATICALLTLLSAAALSVGGGLVHAQERGEGQPSAEWAQAYARVDGVAILRTAVDAEAERGAPKAQVLQRLLTMQVMRAGLARAGRDPSAVDAAELDEAVAETEAALKASGKDLDEVLKLSGQSRAEFRADLRLPLAFRGWIRAQIGEDAVRREYEANKFLLGGEARISHILIAVKAGRSRVQARAAAQALLRELGAEAQAEAFARLASERSDEPMASLTGGDLDWMKSDERRRDVDPGLLPAGLARGKTGLVTQPVEGRQGVHLVFVNELRLAKGASFEQHAERVRASLERAAAQRTLLDWHEAAKIEYAPDAPRLERRAPGSLSSPGR